MKKYFIIHRPIDYEPTDVIEAVFTTKRAAEKALKAVNETIGSGYLNIPYELLELPVNPKKVTHVLLDEPLKVV